MGKGKCVRDRISKTEVGQTPILCLTLIWEVNATKSNVTIFSGSVNDNLVGVFGVWHKCDQITHINKDGCVRDRA